MNIYTMTNEQKKAARVAGFSFLLAIATVIVANYGINFETVK
jgi:Mg2+ and Co2+ transporter CorA